MESAPASPVATTASTLVETVSVTSESDTVNVPVTLNAASVSVRGSDALSPPPTLITGASFAPVTVIVTV